MIYQAEKTNETSLYDNRILVVDDAAINRELISSYLKGAGYRNILLAIDGEDALEKAKEFEPDLLILDLLMPKVDGTQVIKELRSSTGILKQMPILVQTSISNPEQRNEAWKYGATDVITKPIHKLELLSRVKVQLENSFLIRELEGYQKVADQEIAKALELQKLLLPSESEVKEMQSKYRISVNSMYLPSRFLSGDMWGMQELNDDQFLVWICDFSGKGISASLYTLRIHTLISEYKEEISSLEDFVGRLNSKLVDIVQMGTFCTFLVGIVDRKEKTFSYVAASSTHPILYHLQKRDYSLGDGSGMPLGISKEATYETRTISYNDGDSLILYSDLMWEDEGGIPGISLLPENLACFFKELDGRGATTVINQQIELLGESCFSDDLTLIEISLNK